MSLEVVGCGIEDSMMGEFNDGDVCVKYIVLSNLPGLAGFCLGGVVPICTA